MTCTWPPGDYAREPRVLQILSSREVELPAVCVGDLRAAWKKQDAGM